MKLKKWTDLYSSQPLNLIYCQANMASHLISLISSTSVLSDNESSAAINVQQGTGE